MTASDWTAALGQNRVRADVDLASFTSFGVGGPAEWLFDAQDTDELIAVVRAAVTHDVPITVLGGGSNVLVADSGVRGLVIRVRTSGIEAIRDSTVRADAGVTLNGLVRWTLLRGLGGLEAWAGTPGSVGGAICGNAHYGGDLIGSHTLRFRVLQRDGTVVDVPHDEMAFGYDASRLQTSGEILLSADFRVRAGEDVDALRQVAKRSLQHRKRTQPLNMRSAGCVFQNPVPDRDRVPDGCPWSAGALIDRAGLKGAAIGGARVSTVHANFIVNERGASASDIKALVELCRGEVRSQFKVELRDEIVYLGRV